MAGLTSYSSLSKKQKKQLEGMLQRYKEKKGNNYTQAQINVAKLDYIKSIKENEDIEKNLKNKIEELDKEEVIRAIESTRQKHKNRWYEYISKRPQYDIYIEYVNNFVKVFMKEEYTKYSFPTRYYYFINDLQEFPKCPVCGKEYGRNIYTILLRDGLPKTCSYECSKVYAYYSRQLKKQRAIELIDARNEYLRRKKEGSVDNNNKKNRTKNNLTIDTSFKTQKDMDELIDALTKKQGYNVDNGNDINKKINPVNNIIEELFKNNNENNEEKKKITYIYEYKSKYKINFKSVLNLIKDNIIDFIITWFNN